MTLLCVSFTSCKKESQSTKITITKEVFDRTVPGIIKSKDKNTFNISYLQDIIQVEVSIDIYNEYEQGDSVMMDIYNVYDIDNNTFVETTYKIKDD